MIRVENVSRHYPNGVAALEGVSFEVAAHEWISITGPSGCGKSTLLHLLGGLDTPTGGALWVGDLALHQATEPELTGYRRRDLGIVFQFFHLLPTLSVLENVCLPSLLLGEPLAKVRQRASELLGLVGLEDRASHRLHQLSGGQMQRAAIARALIHEPKLLLADEPTGNLDSASASQVLALLEKIASLRRTTLILVTHSEDVARQAERCLAMRDGRMLPPE